MSEKIDQSRQIINIEAWSGAGKSTLASLLDGHPDIFCSPVHDAIIPALLQHNQLPNWLATGETEYLRNYLCRSYYYRIEYFARIKKIGFPISGKDDDWCLISFPLDFYKFEEKWNMLLDQRAGDIRVYDILYFIYDSMAECLGMEPGKHIASMGVASFDLAQLIKHSEKIRTLHIRRPIKDIFATRVNRKNHPFRGNSIRQGFTGDFSKRLIDGEVEKISLYYEAVDRAVAERPDKVLIVDFDEMVLESPTAMQKIARFLDIEYTDTLIRPTMLGCPLIGTGGSAVLGQVNDSASNSLSPTEINLIQLMAFLSRLHRVRASPLAINRFIAGLAKNIKQIVQNRKNRFAR